ncbi:hypothetical protein [Mycobacterium hubeiense]|uniref:hypothetical protein n=1 Tax=Mycobacterium hubeiense TaxID=1867256 RepID=UPI001E2FB62E|nr:hypothetical protein [Mycobacterium sp. QGD 101]
MVRPDSNGGSPTADNGSDSEFASADDTGPANIITEDPTCDAWQRISREESAESDSVNWDDRDHLVPATAWTAEQRTMYETAGKAMTKAADQTQNLVTQTPKRVIRELYQQYIAYTRAFVDAIPSYVSEDDNLVITSNVVASALTYICLAIEYRSAQPVAPVVPEPEGPSAISDLGDPSHPQRFLTKTNSVCDEWAAMSIKFDDDTAGWRAIDPKIPAAKWTPEQKSVNDAIMPVMTANADEMERLGRESGNPVLEDIAVLAAQYRRAFVNALPTYTSADNALSQASVYLAMTVKWACKAVAT